MKIEKLFEAMYQLAVNPESIWGTPDYDPPKQPGYVDIRKSWHNTDNAWSMSYTSGLTQYRPTTLWWHHWGSGGNTSHQELRIHHDNGGNLITRLELSTVAPTSGNCYTIEFDLRTTEVKYYIAERCGLVTNRYGRSRAVEDFDSLVLDLIGAMLPPFVVCPFIRSRSTVTV